MVREIRLKRVDTLRPPPIPEELHDTIKITIIKTLAEEQIEMLNFAQLHFGEIQFKKSAKRVNIQKRRVKNGWRVKSVTDYRINACRIIRT